MPALSIARANSIILSNYILAQHMKEEDKLKLKKKKTRNIEKKSPYML